ncbi:MAG: single-stranded-DNA-specific exonuclease RecJ [Candidatus Eremiobacteraeota bacterium]|nr:single-stranded-DNA-specific exonuclease RecJ [Candidatus Eremiobacteraeota bacterium]
MRRPKRLPPPTPSEAAFAQLVRDFGTVRHAPEGALRQAQGDRAAAQGGGRHPELVEGPPSTQAGAFLAALYEKAGEFLSRDPYATIGDATGFNTKVVGVSFEGRQDTVAALRIGETVELRRDAANAFDASAIGVWYGSLQLGFLKRPIAARLAPNVDAGERYTAEVTAITGGGTRSFGINIYVTRERAAASRAGRDRAGAGRDDVLRALIGERPLRDAQRAVLERLDARGNVLAVLGTGRGKSLCFQYPAAVRALERGEKTVVLYPLRALANDQYDALMRRLEPLGLRIHRANGAIDAGERAALNEALETGAWDLICATPEFVQFHLDRFRSLVSQPSLIVVDEAHHISESTHRAAYQRLGSAIAALGAPQVLALTATAGDEAFAKIREALRIDAWVIDPTVRDNLHVVDARGTADKVAYIERFARDGEKAIVYCNSRTEATKTAEKLRRQLGDVVAFYHAGVASAERAQVESYFREGVIRVVVATSAFGEGIDLPDVRHVFLYHLNFDFTEFNQQSGRAGRDGDDASIHLLFGEKDRRINDYIIDRAAPRLETLRTLYAAMKRMTSDGTLRSTYVDIAATLDLDRVDQSTISTAVRIFADAGLVETGDDDDGRFVRFLPVDGKVDLTATERFVEGEAERDAFARFSAVVLAARPEVLEALIDRPIYPSGVPLLR